MNNSDAIRTKRERFDDALSRANSDAFESLITTIRKGKAIAVVGAGISIRAGYPSWSSLLSRLGEEVIRGSWDC